MEKRIILIVPFILSFIDIGDDNTKYLTYWFSSLFIVIFVVFFDNEVEITGNDKLAYFFRPLYLPHIIFAFYMSLSTIFYYFDVNGYYYFEFQAIKVDFIKIHLLAECQRLYLLAHLFYVVGLYITTNYDFIPSYKFNTENYSNTILNISIVFFVLSLITKNVQGLSQLSIGFEGLSYVSSIMLITISFVEAKFAIIGYAISIFVFNYILALTSGSKEAMITPILFLNVYLLQRYRLASFIFFIPIFIFFFYYLPTFNIIIRSLGLSGEMSSIEQITFAINEIESGNAPLEDNNWYFLVYRLSEVDMFIKYFEAVPAYHPHYDFQIVKQGLEAIIPRILYPDKPNIETQVMERVRELGIIAEYSSVSAKPTFVADCYLSFGSTGIIIGHLILGVIMGLLGINSERLFGGYTIGTSLILTGLFKGIWKPFCFEFLFNNIFWSTMIFITIFFAFRSRNLLLNPDE
ncbi:MAG: hypothetical protein NW207_00035 [Cytophagales bacterium]|nr:hypothetical protein [Cytophagales bacterium]